MIPTTGKNLVDTCADNGTFTTFGKAIGLAGMTDKLSGPGPFTVFAPTDAAFEKLPAGQLETLFKAENQADLVSLVNYHVIAGRKLSCDLGKWSFAKTANGQSTPISMADKQLSIGAAQVTTPDIDSTNGIIHGIDAVNIPTRQ